MEPRFAQSRRNGERAERAWKLCAALWIATASVIAADLVVQATHLWELSGPVVNGTTQLRFAPQNVPLRHDAAALIVLVAGVLLPAFVFRHSVARALERLSSLARRARASPYRSIAQDSALALDIRVATHATRYVPRLAAGLFLRSCPAVVGTWFWFAARGATWGAGISAAINATVLTAISLVCVGCAVPTRRRVFGSALSHSRWTLTRPSTTGDPR